MDPQYYGAAAEYNKPKRSKLFSGKFLFIIVGALVVLLLMLVLFTILGAIASGPRNDLARLTARTNQLQNIIDKNQNDIHSPTLKKLSAEAKLFVSTNYLALKNAYSGDIPDTIAADEADATVSSKLTEATKAGKYDETYLGILKEKVAATLELAEKIQVSGGQVTKTAAAQTLSSLTAVNDQLKAIEL